MFLPFRQRKNFIALLPGRPSACSAEIYSLFEVNDFSGLVVSVICVPTTLRRVHRELRVHREEKCLDETQMSNLQGGNGLGGPRGFSVLQRTVPRSGPGQLGQREIRGV